MGKTKLEVLKEYIELQACDEGLWFDATYATEEYVQQELRRIAWLIEKASIAQIRREMKRMLEQMP